MPAQDRYDVAVIGAGQAGLTIGYELARQRRRFIILDTADSVGAAWRTRWDSLTLFTPRRYDSLPGLDFPGDPNGYPNRDEVVAYLEDYARRFALPISLNTHVRRVGADAGGYILETDQGALGADQVVVATGPFQQPYVPTVASQLSPAVDQAHSVKYRRPSEVPPGTVLVVGGGNTGFQIAEELSSTHDVVLSVGSRQIPLPQRIIGRDLFWWLTKSRLIQKTIESRLGSRMQHKDTLIGSSPRGLRRRHGVTIKPRAISGQGNTVRFEDGTELDVDAVIWATGYRSDYSWIDLPVFEAEGGIRHRRGVTDVPGFYFLGLYWQWTRGSALIGWVNDDAEYIAQQIEAHERHKQSMSPPSVERGNEVEPRSADREAAHG